MIIKQVATSSLTGYFRHQKPIIRSMTQRLFNIAYAVGSVEFRWTLLLAQSAFQEPLLHLIAAPNFAVKQARNGCVVYDTVVQKVGKISQSAKMKKIIDIEMIYNPK